MALPNSTARFPGKCGLIKWLQFAAPLLALLQPESLLAASETATGSADEKNVLMWLGIAGVVGIAIAAAVLQRRDKLIVFRDYTDATITVLSFLVPLAAFWILKSNQSDQTMLWLVSGGLLAVAVALMLINTADANGGLGNPYFYLALAAKVIFMAVFLLLVALLVASVFRGSMGKKSDETQWDYERRKESEARAAAALAAFIIGLVTGGFMIFCKESGFGSPAPVFGSVKRIFAGDMQAGPNQNALGVEIPLVPPRPITGAMCVAVGLAAAFAWWSYASQQIGSGGGVAQTESEVTQAAYRKTEESAERSESPAQNYPNQSQSIDSVTAYQPQRQGDPSVLEFDEALERANNGDAYVQAIVSFYYGLGYKTSKDVAAAADYASRSATQGNPLGLYRMGSIVQSGDGLQKSTESGKAMKIQSLSGLDQMSGDPYAMTALGIMLFRGEGVAKDRSAAARLYQGAAETGYAPALYNYAACLMAGHGVAQDQQLALQYWRAAYEQNYPPAMDGPPPVK